MALNLLANSRSLRLLECVAKPACFSRPTCSAADVFCFSSFFFLANSATSLQDKAEGVSYVNKLEKHACEYVREEQLANGHANGAVAEVVDEVHGHKEEAEACDRTVRHTTHDDTRHNRK